MNPIMADKRSPWIQHPPPAPLPREEERGIATAPKKQGVAHSAPTDIYPLIRFLRSAQVNRHPQDRPYIRLSSSRAFIAVRRIKTGEIERRQGFGVADFSLQNFFPYRRLR